MSQKLQTYGNLQWCLISFVQIGFYGVKYSISAENFKQTYAYESIFCVEVCCEVLSSLS